MTDVTAQDRTNDGSFDCFMEPSGSLLADFSGHGDSLQLVVMPIARVDLDWIALRFPGNVHFYPQGSIDFGELNVVRDWGGSSLAARASIAAGVDIATLDEHCLVAFPHRIEWQKVFQSSHNDHLALIRRLSEVVDNSCLNLIRYHQCPIGDLSCLPARAGQLASNHMMAGALLYDGTEREARVLGGAAFFHIMTKGLGLPLESVPHALFPKEGEIGFIVRHALSLYAAMLESQSESSKFVQCLSLLEYLASPDTYERFADVKKTIGRYCATNKAEYDSVLERLYELTGKKDDAGMHVGLRTRIVHIGARIEDLVPEESARRELFLELDGYIRPAIDHMIAYSHETFAAYEVIREGLRPFDVKG